MSPVDRHSRVTPVVTINETPLAGNDAELLADFDKTSAELAVHKLAEDEQKLRDVSPLRFVRRAHLRYRIRANRLALRSLGVDISIPVSDWERFESWRGKRRPNWRRVRSTWAPRVGGTGAVLLVCWGVYEGGDAIIDSMKTTPAERIAYQRREGREARRLLELVAEAETRYAAENKGRFTASMEKLAEAEPEGSASASTIGYAPDEIAFVKTKDGFRLDLVSGPRFSLHYRYGGRYQGSCAASRNHGCVEGRWRPVIVAKTLPPESPPVTVVESDHGPDDAPADATQPDDIPAPTAEDEARVEEDEATETEGLSTRSPKPQRSRSSAGKQRAR